MIKRNANNKHRTLKKKDFLQITPDRERERERDRGGRGEVRQPPELSDLLYIATGATGI